MPHVRTSITVTLLSGTSPKRACLAFCEIQKIGKLLLKTLYSVEGLPNSGNTKNHKSKDHLAEGTVSLAEHNDLQWKFESDFRPTG